MQPRGKIPQNGFTLVELVMVIIILAIVGGGVSLLIGRLPSTATASTSAGTISQAARAILQFRALEGRFPSRFDLLLADHTTASFPASLVPDLDGDGQLNDTIDPSELAILNLAGNPIPDVAGALAGPGNGIGQVVESPDSVDVNVNQTVFQTVPDASSPTPFSQLRSVGELEHVVVLGSAAINRLGLNTEVAAGEPPIRYVVFGLGNSCEIVGEAILNAPIHSRQEIGAAIERYARFMPVFRVENSTVSLATVVALENDEGVARVVGAGDFLQAFYDDRRANLRD